MTTEARSGDGEGGPVGPGDLIRVGKFWITRGTEAHLVFRSGRDRLWQRGDDGKERLVGAVAATGPAGEVTEDGLREGNATHVGARPERDTFSSLAPEEIAGLRCVRVIRPDSAMTARLATLDLERTVLVGAGAAADPTPALPAGTRFLVLGQGPSQQGPTDLTSLAARWPPVSEPRPAAVTATRRTSPRWPA